MPDDGMVFGTARSRLAREMNLAHLPEEERITFSESQATLGRYRESAGLENPYGPGLAAYEPNTVIFDGYREAYNKVQGSKQKEAYDAAIAKASTATYNFGGDAGDDGAVLGNVSGKMGAAINAALALAKRQVPYVWGGTSASGVDCSGLIFYAFKAAGIDMPRYRAVDYGKMVQAPQSGDVVKVSNIGRPTSIRRLFEDDAFRQVMTPDGGAYWQFGHTPNPTSTWASAPVTDPAHALRNATSINRNRTPF